MAQKFVSLEEAATQLGITKDRLSSLREDGKVRAYRDGSSWKFRAEDVDKLETDGLPPEGSGSDLSLGLDSESAEIAMPGLGELSDIEFDLGDEDLAVEEVSTAGPAASDVGLEDLDEPTLPAEEKAGGDDTADSDVLELDTGEEIDELSDSILLSENELGESTDRPPSTIIGKAEMAADLDLDLGPADDDEARMSDVRLAEASTSNVFASGVGDAVLDTEPPSLSDNFGDLDELEIDLEAESSRILSPEDVDKAQQAASKARGDKAGAQAAEMSDLELATSDSSPGGVLDSMSGKSDIELAGMSALELEGDDDDVLGDGSDITLSSESSGINIISPSDSGLALDEVPLAMGSGSPIASGLDLGPTSDDVGLEPLEVAEEEGGAEPFALTPFGEEAGEDEEDSSQIIPLDEVSEDEELLGSPRSAAVEAMGDDFAAIPSAGMLPVGESAGEIPFPGWIIGAMSLALVMLVMCGIMTFDLLRNIWSWDQVYTLNSALMDVLTPTQG